MNFKTILFAAAIAATFSSTASAQCTDCQPQSGPSLGGGLGLGVPGGGLAGLSGTAGTFSAASGGITVANPAGGTVTVPGNVAQAIGALLSGNPTAADRATATEAFGGTTAAAALTDALVAMGSTPTAATVAAAVQAYNTAVQSLPSATAVTPGLLAARSILVGFTQ